MDQPMEEEPAPAKELPQLSLDVLQSIRAAQSQHGLRHGDYGRYRQYCTRRLRRLYKGTKFLHGRGRFVKKTMEPNQVADARHLTIPLISAERAWSKAMEIKGQLAAGPEAPKRMHLQRCLWKAAAWSAELSRLATERCDARTGLEAEAYASWLKGSALLEKEADWNAALTCLLRAKKLWGELSKVGSLEAQAACCAQLEELEPSIRYCSYRLGRTAGADVVADLPASGTDLLGGKLAELAAEQQASASAATDSFEWQGTSYELPSEAVQIALHTAAELAAQLDGKPAAVAAPAVAASDSGGGSAQEAGSRSDDQLATLDKLAVAYNSARAATAEAISSDAGGKGSTWKGLETALHGAAVEAALRKARLQAAAAQARFERTLNRALQPATAAKSKEKERPGRPEDVVRAYDTIGAHVSELSDVAAALGGVAGESLLDATAAQAAGCQAARCYFVAHTHLSAARFPEAAALFQRASDHIKTAVDRHRECEHPDGSALAELEQLRVSAAAFRIAAHARAAAAQERVASGVAHMSLDGQAGSADAAPQGYMVDNLSATHSFAGGPGGKDAHIAPLIPAPEAIPVRPIVLDSARDFIKPPSLEHRLEKKPAARSLTSRLFGW